MAAVTACLVVLGVLAVFPLKPLSLLMTLVVIAIAVLGLSLLANLASEAGATDRDNESLRNRAEAQVLREEDAARMAAALDDERRTSLQALAGQLELQVSSLIEALARSSTAMASSADTNPR
ncbi:hypothetical protein [Asticcacaulis sp. AC402]|uniref:hypothetical protein n=1 Tax=Asticcacaulis sp. AC402 TaxID=1282361 RepID=UPI0003C3C798|nr:hypothetical protein [Asticcacaulis sp. AC402]ESQ76403.1 hypothetical protein ABAC402_04700 [Asticcacaulis sp. AC402]